MIPVCCENTNKGGDGILLKNWMKRCLINKTQHLR